MKDLYDENDEVIEHLTLTDQDGEEKDFEVYGCFQVNGEDYMALFPVEENEGKEDGDEYQIALFKMDMDDEDELILSNIDDEEESEMVFDEFCKYIESLEDEDDEEDEEDEDEDDDFQML